ncbi:hypothetical protein Agub_g12464, partial [Astrephomene gubernaculifera]
LSGPMGVAIAQLVRQAKPDRLIIEPSGLGHPAGLLDVLYSEHLRTALDVKAVICLVDVRHIAAAEGGLGEGLVAGDEEGGGQGGGGGTGDDGGGGRGGRGGAPVTGSRGATAASAAGVPSETFQDQVNVADVVVGHKADLASPGQLGAFERWAEGLYPPKIRVVTASGGRVDAALLDLPRTPVFRPLFRPQSHVSRRRAAQSRSLRADPAPPAAPPMPPGEVVEGRLDLPHAVQAAPLLPPGSVEGEKGQRKEAAASSVAPPAAAGAYDSDKAAGGCGGGGGDDGDDYGGGVQAAVDALVPRRPARFPSGPHRRSVVQRQQQQEQVQEQAVLSHLLGETQGQEQQLELQRQQGSGAEREEQQQMASPQQQGGVQEPQEDGPEDADVQEEEEQEEEEEVSCGWLFSPEDVFDRGRLAAVLSAMWGRAARIKGVFRVGKASYVVPYMRPDGTLELRPLSYRRESRLEVIVGLPAASRPSHGSHLHGPQSEGNTGTPSLSPPAVGVQVGGGQQEGRREGQLVEGSVAAAAAAAAAASALEVE